jgi:hypothetical protein
MHSPLASFRLNAAALAVFFGPSLAHAHITLTDPPARHPAADLKDGPCGTGAGDSRTTDPAKITEYTAGETITISFTESIQHPSHYRVMLSSTGDAGFTDPTGYEDTTLSPGDLVDGVMDDPAGGGAEEHEIEVTLPNEACEECTIQLIQVMYDKEPWGPEPNAPLGADIYYQCADIVILPGEGGGSGGASSGGASGSGGNGSGGAPGTGGVVDGSGGATSGTGGSPSSSGGAPSGTGGAAATGGSVNQVSDGGSGGGGVTPPAMQPGCSVSGVQAGADLGGVGGLGGIAGWVGLAGLGWLAVRRRRAQA